MTGGEVTDGSGLPWWQWLAGVNAVAPCDGNGPRGPKPINYLCEHVRGWVMSVVAVM